MNGRVYDPVLGRFLSADPNIDGVADAQGYNRYSYVGNNPLGATDPTGFFKLKDALKIVAVVAVAVFTAVYAGPWIAQALANSIYGAGAWGVLSPSLSSVFLGVGGGLAGGFASGFAGSLLNGGSIGDAFKAGITGGVTGAITGGLLGYVGGMELNPFSRGLAHGAVHGGAAEATGGEFRHGFYAGFLNGALDGKIAASFKDSETLQYTAAAIVGGTGSAIGGGKFENGAISGAFSYMFNQEGGILSRVSQKVKDMWKEIMGPQIVHPQNNEAPVPLALDDDPARVANRVLATEKAHLIATAAGMYRQGVSLRYRPFILGNNDSWARLRGDIRFGLDTYDGAFFFGGGEQQFAYGPARLSGTGGWATADPNRLSFKGQTGLDINPVSFGVNLVNPGHSLSLSIFGPIQLSWHSQPLIYARPANSRFIQ